MKRITVPVVNLNSTVSDTKNFTVHVDIIPFITNNNRSLRVPNDSVFPYILRSTPFILI